MKTNRQTQGVKVINNLLMRITTTIKTNIRSIINYYSPSNKRVDIVHIRLTQKLVNANLQRELQNLPGIQIRKNLQQICQATFPVD